MKWVNITCISTHLQCSDFTKNFGNFEIAPKLFTQLIGIRIRIISSKSVNFYLVTLGKRQTVL